jgi:hypothetical protein
MGSLENILFLELVALLRALLKHLLPLPSPIRNLKGTVTMSTVTLKWTDPTTRTDGSALAPTDIAGIDLFEGTTKAGTVAAGVQTFTTGDLPPGEYNFTAVVNDTTGHVSAPSNTFTATIAAVTANPSPIADLSGTVNP